jgi:hypothetical protein
MKQVQRQNDSDSDSERRITAVVDIMSFMHEEHEGSSDHC